ncbi:MAG: VPLPA-CTERM sorting domain-containing protein [Pseudomonadota bacterium]
MTQTLFDGPTSIIFMGGGGITLTFGFVAANGTGAWAMVYGYVPGVGQATPVPLPAGFPLMLAGAAAFGFIRRSGG